MYQTKPKNNLDNKTLITLLVPILVSLVSCQSSNFKHRSPSNQNTKVADVSPEKFLNRIAFGSCSTQEQEMPILKTVLKTKPDIYVATGDNVYASKPENKPISSSYKKQEQHPEFSSFRSEIPIIATWDDHDYGQNDGGASNPEKQEAQIEFLNFFSYAKNYIPDASDGIYHSINFGPEEKRIQFIFLDTRWNRSELEKPANPENQFHIYEPTKNTTKTILGEKQWQWLESELRKPAQLKFLISSIQVIPEQHGFEKWQNFPHERQRLLNLIESLGLKNIIIVSGDRHFAEFSQLPMKSGYNLNELTASAINRPGSLPTEPNRWRLGPKYNPVNFGLADIDWKQRFVTLSLLNLKGEIIYKVEQQF